MVGRTKWMPIGIATVLHFLVDGFCLCCLYMMTKAVSTTDLLTLFLSYNIVAFMTQPLTGWWTDRLSHLQKTLFLSICLLTAAAVMLMADALWCGFTSFSTIIVAILLGMGNSLFHVWGGKLTAVLTGNDMRALGIFVSTGIMGLAIGAIYASWWLIAWMLLSITISPLLLPQRRGVQVSNSFTSEALPPLKSRRGLWLGLLLAILVFVLMRSLVGGAISVEIEMPSNVLLLLGFTAMTGKALGGWIARWLGINHAIVVCVGITAACLMWRWEAGSSLLPALIGILAINFTMPMTLHLANRLLPTREGLSFGLLATMLIPGFWLSRLFNMSTLQLFILSAMLLTISVEVGMLLLMGEKRKNLLLAAIVINALTNAPLNYFLLTFGKTTERILGGELLVLLVEALWYYLFVHQWHKAAIYSLICNATSFLLGILIQLII